jgi:hypothetical protein
LINKDLLDISNQVKGLDTNTEDNPKLVDILKDKFAFRFIGAGISRFVFKQRCKRVVYKIDFSGHYNFAEYCLYHGCKDTVFEPILANSSEISPDGVVLIQEYVRNGLPEYSFMRDTCDDFCRLTDVLEKSFGFLGGVTGDNNIICDFHDGNIKRTPDYNLKIIDYAAPLHSICVLKKFNPNRTIEKIYNRAKNKTAKISFYINQQNELVLEIGSKIITLNSENTTINNEIYADV